MIMNVIERIQGSYVSLTATEQQAASFILGHLTDVLVCSSAELSQLSGISQPTLSRLYRKLGYHSAGEFKHDVRRYHQPGAPETATPDVVPNDPVEEQLSRDVDSLKRTYARISTELLTSMADRILDARHVALMGLRNSYPVALHLREQLIQTRGNLRMIPLPGQSLAEEIVDLGEDDLAILVGVRRRTAMFGPLASALHEQNVPMILIGDSTLRRTATAVGATFLEVDLNSRVLSSFTAAFSVVALLANAVADRSRQRGMPGGGDDRIAAINDRFIALGEMENTRRRL
ncbi:MurR/RpiR family transcriptional regulator [uncultured Bifidobacterium sp.]|uniref:MurR/RpiR family transcriptional regulator n=1 Tax=uncultured Bifidobacterium sp. TaxID=165187 RepID=UPI0028DB9081|nr:MurR/RpiR family transcriptional regulator [uncultured Bifidobacterium sp.]